MRFQIAPDIARDVPRIFIGIVVAEGVDNGQSRPALAAALAEAVAAVLPGLGDRPKEDPRVLPYREAFAALGINPNKYMCSIEALLTRIKKTGALPSINPAVDAGNAVSVRRLLPIGAHDLGRDGETTIELRRARAGDAFVPFGSAQAEAVDPGEVVYASGGAVRTRRWMWRQSEIGKIGPETTRIFYPIDGFAGTNERAVLEARDELAELLSRELGARVAKGFVSAESPVFMG
ncbi:MAG: phenylalanine--tRNA ligase beta subunit-related protein [Spirochaetaceae bacterium]|nr:phenylalanine--tRNA ligase beta subunit-related protein [Spirochaetaceae bacterium]